MKLTLHRLHYKDLKEEIEIPYDDKYGILSAYLIPSVRRTLLANPNLSDDASSALNLVIADGTIVGRNMLMPTRIKANDIVVTVQTGGSYEVAEQMQGRGIGKTAFSDSILNSEYDTYIGQLYSTTAIAIVRKLGLTIFELPCFYKLCRSRPILEAKGLRGAPLKIGAIVADMVLKLANCPSVRRLKKIKKLYQVKQETTIPAWVNDITLHDGHIFTEVHDSEWLQWCLDNRFTENPEDQQSFYTVYDQCGNPQGFFMTKIRFEKSQGKYKNITRGTVVEWGSYNENVLSELDLNLLAADSFGAQVDNVITVLSGSSSEREMNKLGFIRHGKYQMSLKPGNLDQDGISDQSKWRIRYGGCNTIVF